MRVHLRTRHYSIRTEEAYIDWARRFILFHGKRHPRDMGAVEVEAFLSHLAVERHVSASTQNQAKAALLYLYKQVLEIDLPWLNEVVQAKRPKRLPVVLTPTEVRELLLHMDGTTCLIAQLLYGTGMRLLEALRLRVKDVEFARREIVVREGKGNKDRVTVLPENLMAPLQAQLQKARLLHEKDLAAGLGRVYLPHALAAKYPQADQSWAWQWVFPSPVRAIDPRPDARTGELLERLTMCTRNRCSAPCARRRGARRLPSPSHPMCCATRLPHICCKRVTTFARCKSCWGMPMSVPP